MKRLLIFLTFIFLACSLFGFTSPGRWGATKGFVKKSDCSTITEGCCVDAEDGTLFCVDTSILGTLAVGSEISSIDVEYPISWGRLLNGDVVSIIYTSAHDIASGSETTEIISWTDTIGANKPLNQDGNIQLLDGSEFLFKNSKSGWAQIIAGDLQEYADFKFNAVGSVVLINNSSNVSTTKDTASNLNIYSTGSEVGVNHKLGSEVIIRYSIGYSGR